MDYVKIILQYEDILLYAIIAIMTLGILGIVGILLYKRIKQRKRLQYLRKHYPCAAAFHGLPAIISNSDVRNHLKKLRIPETEWIKLESKINKEKRRQQIIKQKASQLKELYPQGWKIIHQQHPDISDEQIITLEQKLELEEQKYHKKQQEALLRKQQRVTSNLSTLLIAISNGNIELAERTINNLHADINNSSTIDHQLIDAINQAKTRFYQQYTEGFSESYENTYVNYLPPAKFIQGDDWSYAVAKFPAKGSIVFPYRRRKIARRGYMENDFQSFLEKNLSAYGIQIIGDCSILAAENYRPYEPDIAIIDKENPAIRIDIEIDEPYSAIINKPTHYIGCGDDFRDLNLNNLGWIVVRFSEYQVYSDMIGCAAFIVQIMHVLSPNREFPDSFLRRSCVAPRARWTETEAKVMAYEKAREQYLNHEFGIVHEVPIEARDIKQNEQEKICTQLVKPLILIRGSESSHSFATANQEYADRDSQIQFYPQEHIYVYNGREQFLPVSSVVACFFKPFDADYWSAYKAQQRRVPQGKILEEWDAKGALSREVGTFMHKQIENHYQGLPYQQKYPFIYNGNYIHIDEVADLRFEYMQFMQFCADHPFTPYRTEWAIYDEYFKIAGTIDMIHHHDGTYDIYDWKRSSKILNFLGKPIMINSFGEKGTGKLSHIDDTPYWHYCIQQNIYRYILEKNYMIKVNKMFLVVFEDQQESYVKLEVPYMTEVPNAIEDAWEKGVLRDKLYD